MLGLPAQTVAEILGGDRPITSDLARGIGDALGTGAQLWLNLQEHLRSRRESAPPNVGLGFLRASASAGAGYRPAPPPTT